MAANSKLPKASWSRCDRAPLTMFWSNGQAECQINRLRKLKRNVRQGQALNY